MIALSNEFVEDLICEDNPLDRIWEYLVEDVWVHDKSVSAYYNQGEKKTGSFERFFKDAYFEIYDLMAKESLEKRKKLRGILKRSEYCLIVADGLSIREANLLLRKLEENGYNIKKYTYEISNLPSDTIAFSRDFLNISAPSALRTSGEWRGKSIYIEGDKTNYPVPYSDKVLIYSIFPDADFDNVTAKIGDSLEMIYLKASNIILKQIENTNHDQIIITSDHGYCTKHPGCNWSIPVSEKEIFQEVFGSARFKEKNKIFGDMEEKIEEILDKTDRLKKVGDNVIVNGRYIWPVPGSKKQIYHGGISFMENFVPLIEVEK